jgi:hypothetical protein
MNRKGVAVIGPLIRKRFFVGIAQIEELQSAFKELVDLFFGDFVRREERLKVEVGKSAIGHAGREQFAQMVGLDRAKLANFFEDHAAEWITENAWRERLADFRARAALDQDGTKKPQGVPFQKRLIVWLWRHREFQFTVRVNLAESRSMR